MPVKIFFCYAHEDEPLLSKLKKHMRLLQWQGLIDIWFDRDISAGKEWELEISEQLNTAQIILLLVSPDFMNSDYCYGIEMKRAMERHERGEAQVIPVILRHIYWQGSVFGKLQALPKNAKPTKSWQDQDKAFFDVAEDIRKLVEKIAVHTSANNVSQQEKRDRFDKFSERARRVLSFAEEEAIRHRHLYIGTEHLLVGLVCDQDLVYGHASMALTVLEHLGIEPNKVRSEVEGIVGTGNYNFHGEMEITISCKKVIEFAVDEARRMGNHYVGSEHLLLGLLRVTNGIASQVLQGLGINLEKARTEVVRTNDLFQNLSWRLR